MIFLWTTSDRWGSKLIRWGRGHDCSHFAIVFDKLLPNQMLVTESRIEGGGVGLGWLAPFKQRNKIVHALEYTPMTDDNEAFRLFGKKMAGRRYDKKAVVWLSFDSLLRKLGLRNPYSENKWGDSDDVYCQEVIDVFKDLLKLPYGDVEMLYPHDTYEILVKQPQWRKIDV